MIEVFLNRVRPREEGKKQASRREERTIAGLTRDNRRDRAARIIERNACMCEKGGERL